MCIRDRYTGAYHLHNDGTAMINKGVLGVVHDLNLTEIIIRRGIRDTNTRRKF